MERRVFSIFLLIILVVFGTTLYALFFTPLPTASPTPTPRGAPPTIQASAIYMVDASNNHVLSTYTGMLGIKTGHSAIAGYCLVFEATQNGHYIMGTILGSPDGAQRDTDVSTLLNWGFGKLNGSF